MTRDDHSTGGTEHHENFVDALMAAEQQFEEEYDDLEAIIEGDIGFHAFFVAEGDDATRGVHTAVYQGIYDCLQEVSVDAEIVEIQHGEVTPDTVWKETRTQLEEFTYLPDTLLEPVEDRVKERIQKNLEQRCVDTETDRAEGGR